MDKSALTQEELIEYYLGKDRLPNLHWQAEIPPAWSIIPRKNIKLCNPDSQNTTVTLSENIPYQLNNLGYRSNFNYYIDKLKEKQIILVLGDSDTFGRGSNFDEIYSTKMQKLLPNHIVINLGIASTSPDAVARVGTQSMMALGTAVKHICILWPIFSNREFVSKKFQSGVHVVSNNLPYPDWYNHIDWVSNNYNYQKNKILLEQTALSIGANYHDLIVNRYDKKAPTTFIEVDSPDASFTEFTSETHTAIANYFLRKINNRPSLYNELKTTQS
jgi:hypothetical protein